MAHPSRPNAKSVAELIGKSLDPLARKRGLARAELIAWWPDIVGATYAGRTVPERIRWSREGAATLVVRCDPSLALQFSHETAQVRDRLNSYFGYPAVGAVKIVQHPVGTARPPESRPSPEREIPPELARKLDAIDGPLKESLSALGRKILART